MTLLEAARRAATALAASAIGDDALRRLGEPGRAPHRAAEATWAVDGAIARLRADAEELWQMAEGRVVPSMAQRGHFRCNMNRGCRAAGEAVHELFRAATGRSIFLDHPLQRRFQDVQGALGHTFLDPDPLARAVGAALLGASKQELVL
jgi:3-hydroxy-9,10-secoandrosta-1,3,5(10)-triene-9,17-dione monooxygenase